MKEKTTIFYKSLRIACLCLTITFGCFLGACAYGGVDSSSNSSEDRSSSSESYIDSTSESGDETDSSSESIFDSTTEDSSDMESASESIFDSSSEDSEYAESSEVTSDSTSEDNEETSVHSVVFKETGYTDVVIYVNDGEGVETLPACQGQAKTGYKWVWNKTDLSVITEDTVVTAVETAKTYTITFELDGGSLDVQSLEVTYDATYELPTPTHSTYNFFAWYYGDQEISQTGKWKIDGENIVLTAVFNSWEGPF